MKPLEQSRIVLDFLSLNCLKDSAWDNWLFFGLCVSVWQKANLILGRC